MSLEVPGMLFLVQSKRKGPGCSPKWVDDIISQAVNEPILSKPVSQPPINGTINVVEDHPVNCESPNNQTQTDLPSNSLNEIFLTEETFPSLEISTTLKSSF